MKQEQPERVGGKPMGIRHPTPQKLMFLKKTPSRTTASAEMSRQRS